VEVAVDRHHAGRAVRASALERLSEQRRPVEVRREVLIRVDLQVFDADELELPARLRRVQQHLGPFLIEGRIPDQRLVRVVVPHAADPRNCFARRGLPRS
jgi:hypothetical protein